MLTGPRKPCSARNCFDHSNLSYFGKAKGRCSGHGFFYEQAAAFNKVKSPAFKAMIDAVADAGKGYITPSYNKLREDGLDDAVHASGSQQHLKPHAAMMACQLATRFAATDGPTYRNPLINILPTSQAATCSCGPSMLQAKFKGADHLADPLCEQIEEVHDITDLPDVIDVYVATSECNATADRRPELRAGRD